MIEIRDAVSDADIEAWIAVHRVVMPGGAAGTVELERARANPERLLVVAELDGRLAGGGYAERSSLRDRFVVEPQVLPTLRRRGAGAAILRRLAAHAESCGVDRLKTDVADDGSKAFAERFGFRESGGQVEQVKHLRSEPPPPPLPDGITVVTIAERPDLVEAAYPLACQGFADLAERPAEISPERWRREATSIPAGSFLALANAEIVGLTGLLEHDRADLAQNGLTVVRRDWRRRGLAVALKRRQLAWAEANGFREVVTWTQNEGMRSANERLGYVVRTVWTTMVATLPLEPGR